MSRLRLETRPASALPPVEHYEDHGVFQTDAWVDFVAATQAAEPVRAAVLADGGRLVGRFTGLVVRRAGLRILGSPLPGWTTSYMGFNLEAGVSRYEALRALRPFAFGELGCVHVELMDRRLTVEEVQGSGFRHELFRGYEVDLTPSEEAVLGAFSSACRRCLRKARDVGVVVERATDGSFVDDYYSQLREVFGRQGLAPTYSRDRVAALVDRLLPDDRLLLLRARDVSGTCIATGIFPAAGDTMYFWGGASRTEQRILRPNEAVQWEAMRYWRARGVTRYDMGGAGEYKRKYGGASIAVPWLRQSRFPALEPLRSAVRGAVRSRQLLRHRAGL